MKRLLWLLCILLPISNLCAQALPPETPFSQQLAFSKYLSEAGDFAAALRVLQQVNRAELTIAQADSLHFFLGWNYYLDEQLHVSVQHLEMVSESSPLHFQATLFCSLDHAYLGENSLAAERLLSLSPTDEKIIALVNFEQAGLSLLRNDLHGFERHAQQFDGRFFAFAKQEKQFLAYADELRLIKRKSPAMAGVLSAVVPGAGKVYAGRPLQGFVALLTTGILAGATYEQFRNGGMQNPQVYVFGAAFSVFYVGNIYGSVFSVKLERDENLQAIRHNVLLDLHVPLRTVFK